LEGSGRDLTEVRSQHLNRESESHEKHSVKIAGQPEIRTEHLPYTGREHYLLANLSDAAVFRQI
jgi:hypothetical protein